MDDIDMYNQFLAIHQNQLLSSGVPNHFWPTLYQKLISDIFDVGNSFQLMLIDYGDENEIDETAPIFQLYTIKEEGIRANDSQEIYLIDHAWTFKSTEAKSHLEQLPSLADRISAITGVDLEDPGRVEKILQRLWRYCQSYSIQGQQISIEDQLPIWYMMDEVGCAVNHSDEPNFRIVPFIFLPTQITYSLLFPIKDSVENDAVKRDFLENITNVREKTALLLPWKFHDFMTENFRQTEPNSEYFTTGHVPESIPDETTKPVVSRDQPLKVFTQYDVLKQHLTSPCFEIVENENEADILWQTDHFRNFKELQIQSPNKFINQFPFEYVLTIKDLLAAVARRTSDKHHDPQTLETDPKWLPTTYNLKTELIEFVAYFQNRQARNLDNTWIIKPFNLARGLDTEITSNLWKILRLQMTGPKIAQKYLHNPVLFYRNEINGTVKFDVRYVILLKSVNEIYIHKKFYLRFANKPFGLNNFDDYEKHFTVMNYKDANLKHLKCEDFVKEWIDQYPDYAWEPIESDICQILSEVFFCATLREPPCGLAACHNSRAIYAADIMLEWNGKNIQPKLLEINWMPDVKRACDYYPDFFDNCFKLLFLDEYDSEEFRDVRNKAK